MALSINFVCDFKFSHVNNFAFILFKKINIIKKGINIKDTLKLYAVLFSCFIYAKPCQRPSGFKAIIISMTKLLDADWLRGVQLFH
jgi:hypothetical protein